MRFICTSIFLALTALVIGCGKKPDAIPTEAEPSIALASKPGDSPTIPTRPTKPPVLDSEGKRLPVGAVLRLGVERVKTDKDFGGAIRSVAFGASGKEILSGAVGLTVRRWSVADGKELEKIDFSKAEPNLSQYGSPHFLGDGRRVIVSLGLYEMSGMKKYAKLPDGLAYFPTRNGEFIATVTGLSQDKKATAAVYSAADGKSLGTVDLPAGLSRTGAAYSPKRNALVTAYTKPAANNKYDAVIVGWDLKTGKDLGEVVLPNGGNINGMALVDDTKVVVGTGYGQLVVVDFFEKKIVCKFDDPNRVNCLALAVSPDGKHVAVCQDAKPPLGRTIRIYDVGTGDIRHTIRAFDGRQFVVLPDLMNLTSPPDIMAFSPDGTRLAVPALSSVLIYDLTEIGPTG